MARLTPVLSLCRWLARPVLLFYTLPWLMILLTAGTLAQAEIGLYQAHRQFFACWILWWGPIPLPGTYLTLTLITLSLSAKFLIGSPWHWHKAGTTLTHLGVLVLLYGGMVTALTQQEGFMVITEGESRRESADYHERVLKIYRDDVLVRQIPFAGLAEGRTIDDPALTFRVTPSVICRNCAVASWNGESRLPRHGMAEKVTLAHAPLEKKDELNLAGMMFDVRGSGDTDGLYATLEDVPMIPRFEDGNSVIGLQAGRRTARLPFSVHLVDFDKQTYPGTNEARAYHSDVMIEDGTLQWPARIEMNEPLRYRGYTFYQSSYTMTPDGRERTVLSVVQNKGWLAPYLASFIIFCGLCIHLSQRLFARRGA